MYTFEKAKPFLAVFGGVLVHLTLGTLYTFGTHIPYFIVVSNQYLLLGNMTPYFTSYIREMSSPSDLRYTDSVWIYALTLAGQGLAMFFGGFLSMKIGTRLTVLIGGWVMRYNLFILFN